MIGPFFRDGLSSAMIEVPSPCTAVCRIDDHSRLCLGCRRTLDEIAAWPVMTDEAKRAVLRQIAEDRSD